MKKAIALVLVAFGMNALVAQTNPSTGGTGGTGNVNTPSSVTNKFGTDYPNTNATWRADGNNYAADYTDGGTNRSVVYDKSGNVVRRDSEMGNGTYPSTISDYYTKNYPNEDYKIWSSEDNTGNKTYYSKRKSGKTIWFDKDGNYMNNKPGKTNSKSSGSK